MKTSTMAQPALPHPLRLRSLNRSKMQRNQMKIAEIQMKIQKLQRRTSQKLSMPLVLIVGVTFQVVVLRSGYCGWCRWCMRHAEGVPGSARSHLVDADSDGEEEGV